MTSRNRNSFEPEGSEYEKFHTQKVSKSPLKRFRKALSRQLTSFCCIIVPPLYKAFMRVVWSTSKVEDNLEFLRRSDRGKQGLVAAMWHENAFLAPHLFLSYQAYTVASTARIGRVIATLLEKHNFKVFRGGTGHDKQGRRKNQIFRSMIYHLKQHPDSLYGIAVDGTKGPARKMKPGICKIAQQCRVPVFLVHTEVKHAWKLPTWDRTVIPLPFNHIQTKLIGPYWIAPQTTAVERERFRQHLESELTRLSQHMAANMRRKAKTKQPSRPFIPQAFSSLDLQDETLPAWAVGQAQIGSSKAQPLIACPTPQKLNKSPNSKLFCLLALLFLIPLAMEAFH